VLAFGTVPGKPNTMRSAMVTTAIAVLVASCGGSAHSASTSRGQYAVAITQCAIDRGLIPKKDLAGDAGADHWLVNGYIVDNSSFAQWWNAYTGVITISGETLSVWQTQAYRQQHRPHICSSPVMPTAVGS
jgi:hypothetical protein